MKTKIYGGRRLLGVLLCIALLAGAVPAMAMPGGFELTDSSNIELREDAEGKVFIGSIEKDPVGGSDPMSAYELLINNIQNMPGMIYGMLDADGLELDKDALPATGVIYTASDRNGEEVDRVTLVLMGDVTGDGQPGLNSLVVLGKAVRGVDELTGPYLIAGDWNRSGTIELADLVRQVQCVRGEITVGKGPKAEAITADKDEYEDQWATFTAEGVTGDDGISRVWFQVTGPDGTKREFLAEHDTENDGSDWSTKISWLDEFGIPGVYTIVAYGTDGTGFTATLGSTTAQVSEGAMRGHAIMGASQCTVEQLVNEQLSQYGWDNTWYGMTVEQFCRLYYETCEKEGVRAEVAYAQMIHETGGLRYGGLVVRAQNNFAGIGASGHVVSATNQKDNYRYTEDGRDAGIVFKTVENGIRSHVQHLKGYASTDDLVLDRAEEYDRFEYMKRGCAPVVERLTGTWAQGNSKYGERLLDSVESILGQSTEMPDYDHNLPNTDEPVRVKMVCGNLEVIYELNDSSVARAFAESLPVTVTLGDDRGTRKWFDMPLAFDAEESWATQCEQEFPDEPAGTGELVYDALFKDINLYYTTFDTRDDLLAIGLTIDSENADKVWYMSGEATISLVDSPEENAQVRFEGNGVEVVYQMVDTTAARSFLAMLPAEVEMEDSGFTLKSFAADGAVNVSGSPTGDDAPGALTYYNDRSRSEIMLWYGERAEGQKPTPIANTWKIGEAISGADRIGDLRGTVHVSIVEHETDE